MYNLRLWPGYFAYEAPVAYDGLLGKSLVCTHVHYGRIDVRMKACKHNTACGIDNALYLVGKEYENVVEPLSR